MNKYNPAIHNRQSLRRKGYDYAQEGLYFITICCQDRLCIFGEVVEDEMILNKFGEIAHNEWLNTPNVRKNIALHEFVIMPNHIHGIIEIVENVKENSVSTVGQFISPSQTLGAIVRGYKIATIKKIKDYIDQNSMENRHYNHSKIKLSFPLARNIINLDYKIWQRNYFERIIWSQRAYENITSYIINNPKRWKSD